MYYATLAMASFKWKPTCSSYSLNHGKINLRRVITCSLVSFASPVAR